MITRKKVLVRAFEECMKELYSYAQPHVEWDDFLQQNREYKEGPRPYEFYYLPEWLLKQVVDDYICAYRIAPELKDNVECLIHYFNNPIKEKYIKNSEDSPSYRSYENFKPLKEVIGEDAFNKVKEYLDEATSFYKWDSQLQSFNMSVYLGCSPNSNKEKVMENWKMYRNKDVTIVEVNKEDFYNEE